MQDRKAKAIGFIAERRKLRAEFKTPKAGDRKTGDREFGSQAIGTPDSIRQYVQPPENQKGFRKREQKPEFHSMNS